MTAFRETSTSQDLWQPAGETTEGSFRFDDGAARAPQNGASRHPQAPTAIRIAQLAKTIEQQVIPRLVLSSRAQPPRAASLASGGPLDSDDVARYAHELLARDADGALAFMIAIESRGFPAETLYLDLLAPTARHLGTLWEQDHCSFTQVSIGMVRLQQVLRRLSPAFQADLGQIDLARRVLLLPMPGEQHTFGLVMVSEFFRRAGWDVWGGPQSPEADTLELVAAIAFQVVGFSVGSTGTLDRLASTIRTVRRRSSNPDIGILVGGPIFLAQPELVALVGADATATDGRHAVQQAHALVAMRHLRP